MHHCAEGWLSVHLLVAIALQNHQFFWFASTGVQVFRLFRRHEAVVVRGDEQNGTGGNLVHHPFWIEAEGIVDVLEGNGIHCCWIMAPSGSGELRRCRSGSRISLRSTKVDSPVRARWLRSAAARARRSYHSSGRRTLPARFSPGRRPSG